MNNLLPVGRNGRIKGRAATVLETPRGPEQTDYGAVEMPFEGYASPAHNAQGESTDFGTAAVAGLIALAARIASSPSHHKRLLTTLYEAGSISGVTLSTLICLHGLEAV